MVSRLFTSMAQLIWLRHHFQHCRLDLQLLLLLGSIQTLPTVRSLTKRKVTLVCHSISGIPIITLATASLTPVLLPYLQVFPAPQVTVGGVMRAALPQQEHGVWVSATHRRQRQCIILMATYLSCWVPVRIWLLIWMVILAR